MSTCQRVFLCSYLLGCVNVSCVKTDHTSSSIAEDHHHTTSVRRLRKQDPVASSRDCRWISFCFIRLCFIRLNRLLLDYACMLIYTKIQINDAAHTRPILAPLLTAQQQQQCPDRKSKPDTSTTTSPQVRLRHGRASSVTKRISFSQLSLHVHTPRGAFCIYFSRKHHPTRAEHSLTTPGSDKATHDKACMTIHATVVGVRALLLR